jgi:hypothetical protein
MLISTPQDRIEFPCAGQGKRAPDLEAGTGFQVTCSEAGAGEKVAVVRTGNPSSPILQPYTRGASKFASQPVSIPAARASTRSQRGQWTRTRPSVTRAR